MKKQKFKERKIQGKAFTLAEVLITLVIIGVIAAITVPTIMAHQKKLEYVTKLQKGYSILNNGFKLALTQDGVNSIVDTSLYSSINGDSTLEDNQEAFMLELSKIFSISKQVKGSELETADEPYKALNGTAGRAFINSKNIISYLNDGMILSLQLKKDASTISNSGGLKHYGHIYLDVNGDKKPNQWGRDAFRFYIEENGKVTPWGLHQTGSASWSECKANANSGASLTCAARIMKESWKMNY